MAKIFVTLKLMLASPEVDTARIDETASKEIKEFAGCDSVESSVEPVAFGLNAVNIKFVMDESKGPLDPLEEKLNSLEDIASVEVTSISRALG